MRVVLIILGLACSPASISQAQPWPAAPPRIGQLSMPQNCWDWTLEAAREQGVSPYVIQGFMAIESRYDPAAMSGRGRCIGLMQLDRGVARGLAVDPWKPRENIHGGARVLAALLKKHRGDLAWAVELHIRKFFCDPREPAFIKRMRRQRLYAVAAPEELGLARNLLGKRLANYKQGIPGGITISRECPKTIPEFTKYRMPERDPRKPFRDVPLNMDNYGISALHFLILGLASEVVPRVRWL